MTLKRKIYSKLLDWKEKSRGTKAILIEGARRIGKSTICEEFAKYDAFNLLWCQTAQTKFADYI